MEGYKKNFLVILLGLFALMANAGGDNKVEQGLYWLNYNVSKKINDQWSVKFVVENRRYIINNRNHMFFVTGETTRKLNGQWAIGAGFTYFELNIPSNPHSGVTVVQPEFRPYQRIGYSIPVGERKSLTFAMTLEERIRKKILNNEQQDQYNAYFRLRNKLTFKKQLTPSDAQRPVSFYAYDDFMVHFGSTVKGSLFDQNRLGFGLECKLLPKLSMSAGYLRWYQHAAKSNTIFNRNILTFSLSQVI